MQATCSCLQQTLASSCYNGMFENCTALKKAYVKAAYSNNGLSDPDPQFCCAYMFQGCTDAATSTFYSDYAAGYQTAFSATLGSWQTAAYK